MKTRIISAIVAIALIIPFIYFGKYVFAFGIGLIALQAFKEVLDLKKTHKEIPIVMSIIALIIYLLFIYAGYITYEPLANIRLLLLLAIIILLVPSVIYKKDKYPMKDALSLLGTIVFLGLAFNSFITVRSYGIATFIYLILIPMITDTFALVFGLICGKHKMCPDVSPKKTWEGFFGGLAIGTIIPCIFYQIAVNPISIKVIIMTAILSVMGQIGDLVFSKLKRENGIKDYSNIMPGHGGALDRLDSTIFIFMTYIYLISIFM